MQANDLITQVHSEEDDSGHHEHLEHDGQPQSQSFWQKFLGCLLCRSKTASPSAAGNKSNIYSKHASVPLQPHNSHINNSNNSNANNSSATPAVLATTAVTKTTQNTPMPSIPLTSTPQPAVQMNGAPPSKYLLPPLSREEVLANKKTLVLDLDETLVHSSFKPIPNADFVLSIDLEGVIHRVYVRKRPGVDHFLRYCAEKFEVVVFTASLAKYADPLLDILDRDHTVRVRLFREACVQHYGNYVKDLTHLGRKLEHTIIVDNSPFSYMFQPENAIPITSWFNDKNDRQLYDLLPHLDHMADCNDVIAMLAHKKLQFVNGQVLLGS